MSRTDLYGLEIELGEMSLANFFLKLDNDERIDVNEPKNREVFMFIFLLVEQILAKIYELDQRFKLKLCTTCGSAFDGTKVGAPDEFDFLLVMETLTEADSNLKWVKQGNDNPEKYDLHAADYGQWYDLVDPSKNKHELVPKKLHRMFSQLVDEAMKNVKLPMFLKHGGFAMPRFSGVRSHRFAHLIQLIWDPSPYARLSSVDHEKRSFMITIDLTLVVSAPGCLVQRVLNMVETSQLLGQYYQTLIDRISEEGSPRDAGMYNDFGVHMIPSSSQGWVLTTAALDFAIMDMFSKNSHLKRCIRICKVLRDRFLTLGETFKWGLKQTIQNQVQFLFDNRLIPSADVADPFEVLLKFCQNQSSAVPPNVFQQLNEFSSPTCSASSGFIKYLSMQEVCDRISDEEFQDSSTVDAGLVMSILEKMSLQPDQQQLGIPHVILRRNIIWPVSMHGYFSTRSSIADSLNADWFKQHSKLMQILKDAL